MTARTGIQDVYRFLSPPRRRQLHRLLLLMLLGAAAEMVAVGAVFPFLAALADPGGVRGLPVVGDLLGRFDVHQPAQVIAVCCALFGFAALTAVIVRLWLLRASQSLVFAVGHDIAVEVQRRVLAQDYAFHMSRNTSELLAALEKVQVLVFNVLLQIVMGTIALVTAAFIVAILLAIDARIALGAMTVFGAIYSLISVTMRHRLGQVSAVMARAYDRRIQIVQESLGGIRDIIVDHSQDVFLDAFGREDGALQRARAESAFIGAAPRILVEGLGTVVIAIVAAGIALWSGGIEAALPTLGAFALGAQRLLPFVQQTYLAWANLAANRSVVGDVLELLRLPAAMPTQEVAAVPFRGHIRFENVSFRYPGRAADALSHVSLAIDKGESVAIVGATGSGKSTLVDLLLGLIEPSAGEVMVDGRPLRGTRRRAWQRNLAHVPQAIFLSDASIAHNIAFGCRADQIDRERVVDAARTAQLDAFIASLPDGYDTEVGERGVRLSGGQRQRLGIARALYKDAPVLILDEATNALDEATEERVVRAIAAGDPARTLIIISHRASTIAACQKLVRIEEGRNVAPYVPSGAASAGSPGLPE